MSSFSSCVYIISSLLFNLLNFSLISLYWDSATFSQPHIIENIICYVCNKVALTQCIYCELCNTWIHQRCIKMTAKTFNLFSISPLPFFCNICISSILPFTTITDKAFSKLLTVKNTQLTLKKCFSCSKSIRLNQNEVFCSLGQHSYHQSCLKIKTNELKKLSKNWSCNSCNAFPFQELDFFSIYLPQSNDYFLIILGLLSTILLWASEFLLYVHWFIDLLTQVNFPFELMHSQGLCSFFLF